MRWRLRRGSFTRFYLLLITILLAVFLIALGGRALIDQVRREDYREQMAALPVSLAIAQLSALDPDQREQRLAALGERLGMALELERMEAADLGYFDRARLEQGKVRVSASPWVLRKRLPDSDWLLTARLDDDWSERHWHAVAQLLGEWLAAQPADQRRERLNGLASGSWPVSLHERLPESLAAGQRAALDRGQVVTRLEHEQLAVTFWARLPGEARWVKMGPMNRGGSLALNLNLPLIMGLLLAFSLSIYLVMRSIESRLGRLELAAGRIANGRLETRVKVEGSDFLGRLGMAFNGMASQVQALLRGQQEMIRAVSHELRTPVARIRFAAQMVEDMTDDPVIHRQLRGIDADIGELDELIDEILTFARLGGPVTGEMEMTRVECRAIASRVIDTLAPLHEGLTLRLAEGPEVALQAEPRYLQRALQNLVSNACRHGHSQVTVTLTGEPELVRIDVEDDGPGVPVDAREEIFQPFSRLDTSRNRSSGGYGLGLSIVQKIMAGHGGSASVDQSETLGGARFTLVFPRRGPPA
ncbi:ATP-binding protein [Halomonas piscis]|uniref:ATP-binding protein n=1 Tax=Halomonas piscis TaxID=3031727 RepID=UPI002899CE9D|nr:ATP-binding protein [Halomonas piscis]